MKLSPAKKRLKDRRDSVIAAYNELKPEESVSELVKGLSKKYKVTEVTIYNDIKEELAAIERYKKMLEAFDVIKDI